MLAFTPVEFAARPTRLSAEPSAKLAYGSRPLTALPLAKFIAPKAKAVPLRRMTWWSLAAAMSAKTAVAFVGLPERERAVCVPPTVAAAFCDQ